MIVTKEVVGEANGLPTCCGVTRGGKIDAAGVIVVVNNKVWVALLKPNVEDDRLEFGMVSSPVVLIDLGGIVSVEELLKVSGPLLGDDELMDPF